MKKHSVIRNPKAYQAKLDKHQRLLDRMKDAVFENLTTVLVDKFDGELTAESRTAVAQQLIRGGVLGGSCKFTRHIGSVFKQYEQTGAIHRFDERDCMDALTTVKGVMEILENTEEITISATWRNVTIKLETAPILDASQLIPFQELSDEFGGDPYDQYDPHNCVRSGRAKVDDLIMNS